jgi:DNA-binding SARP family transcriptional activator
MNPNRTHGVITSIPRWNGIGLTQAAVDHDGQKSAGICPSAEVTLLGGFRLTFAGRDIRLPVGAQRLVALLGLRGRTGRSRLAGILWPTAPEQRALASLRTGIWRVNQAVPDLVISNTGQVVLTTRAHVDVQTLVTQSIDILRGHTLEEFPFSGGVPEDDLLPDWDDDWLVDERERLHQLRLHLLETVADKLVDAGHFGLAVEVALCVIRADPLRESAHRTLVRIHLAEGNIKDAARAYTGCQQVLRRELGVAPTDAMIGLLRLFPAPCRAMLKPADDQGGVIPARSS